MPNIFPSFETVSPNYMEPGLILPYTLASGAFDILAGGDPRAKIGTETMQVYIKKLGIRTKAAAGQQPYNALPSCTINADMISTPTYLLRNRAEWDHHDTAAAGVWGVSLPEAQRLGCRQAMFQTARNALLYGFAPANGEGVLNAAGITNVNLPADTFGDTTVLTYDNGQMATFLLGQILQAKVRMNQLGQPLRVVILGPQRVLGQFTYPGIVQLTSVQRPGGGSETTMQVIDRLLTENKDELYWCFDDTLVGQGAGGNDAVLIVIPEIKVPKRGGWNTNEFAKLTPGFLDTVTMYCDMPVPREIPVPLAGGALDTTFEMRITSGWAVRPEAVTVVSMQYQ